MKNKKNLATIVMAILAVAALFVGSLALFTDRFYADVTLTASTLDLELDEDWANAVTSDFKFKPGTSIKLEYTLTNGGNSAAKVKEMFVINSGKGNLSTGAGTTPEFALYSAKSDGSLGTIITPTKRTASAVFYEFDEYTLNGNVETVTGINTNETVAAYYLVFDVNADNEHQGDTITVEYLAQGLQYGNTVASDWEHPKVVTSGIFTIGGEDKAVVDVAPNVAP